MTASVIPGPGSVLPEAPSGAELARVVTTEAAAATKALSSCVRALRGTLESVMPPRPKSVPPQSECDDISLAGTTIETRYMLELVNEYRALGRVAQPLETMARGLDRQDPGAPLPLPTYLKACSWIERTFGEQSIRACGRRIGHQLGDRLLERRLVSKDDDPHTWVRSMMRASQDIIQDPLKRGWECESSEPGRLAIRRTLPSNPFLNAGLLVGLVERSGVLMPRVNLLENPRDGAPTAVFELRWIADRRRVRSVRP